MLATTTSHILMLDMASGENVSFQVPFLVRMQAMLEVITDKANAMIIFYWLGYKRP